jgi:hypothetical protein
MNRRALFTLAPLAGVALAAAALPAHASGGGEGGESAAPKDSFMRLSTASATILRPDGRRGVMTVEIGLDIPDPELHAKALQVVPRLVDAHNAVVQTVASTLLPGEAPDVDKLAHDLQVATYLILRKRGAVLLLGTVMVL